MQGDHVISSLKPENCDLRLTLRSLGGSRSIHFPLVWASLRFGDGGYGATSK
jgi:hypothetical protein